MSFQQEIFALVTKFSGQNNTVSVPRSFCEMTGSLEAGIFLSQLLYWSDRGTREDGWFYKSYREWAEEIFLTEYQIRKITKQFEEIGFLETLLKKADGAPTLHYRIKQAEFSEWILKFLRNDSVNLRNPSLDFSESITKTTTKTTTKIVGGIGRACVQPSSETQPPPTPPIDLDGQNNFDRSNNPKREQRELAKPKRAAIPLSPHYDPRKFVKGFIPGGAGETPVEVFYERHSFLREDGKRRLSDPLEDDIARVIGDKLDDWRAVVTAWQQSGYNPANISGQLDWYRDGIPETKGPQTHEQRSGNGVYRAHNQNGQRPHYADYVDPGYDEERANELNGWA